MSPDVQHLANMAKEAARELVGEVESVRHSRTLDAGQQVFHVTCRERTSRVVVTINPNGQKASVEWRSGSRGTNYKVCDLTRISRRAESEVCADEKTTVESKIVKD